MTACNQQPSSVALAAMRNNAKRTYPSKSMLDQAMYHKRLYRRDIAVAIVEIINIHKPGTANNNEILDFDCFIQGFGGLINRVSSQLGQNDVIERIAVPAGYEASVVFEMKKVKTLVPRIVCESVLRAASGIFDVPADSFRIVRASLIDHDLSPLPLEGGRTSIFDRHYPQWNA